MRSPSAGFSFISLKGGCADNGCQIIPLLFMALGQQDVSKLKLGQLSPYT